MLLLGKKQKLFVVKEVDFGVYLASEEDLEDKVLLPIKQVPKGTKKGDEIEVFIYKDSSDRIIATTNEPLITLYEVKRLQVVQVTKIGAFLNWGLEKDLLLPFKEQTKPLEVGEDILVSLYIDKSQRLCATMKLYKYLKQKSPYIIEDRVKGTVYEISKNFGVFVAIDDMYQGLIPNREATGKYKVGSELKLRVTAVHEDGKLDVSDKEKAYLQMDVDAQAIMEAIEDEGYLPFTDKAPKELIQEEMGLSKNAFKRAVGRLLKEGKIEIKEDGIYKKH